MKYEKMKYEELNPKYVEILESLGWSICCYMANNMVELEKYSPAGEDFMMCVEVNDFPENVSEYADRFDVEEHVMMWLDAKRTGCSGVPDIETLVEDAECIKQDIEDLANALKETK